MYGPAGDLVDLLAVFATVFGLATSLGLGAMQINAGLAHVFGVPTGAGVQLVIILVITLCATASVVSGLNAGIRRLSELNMVLATLLLLFVFFAGPTLFLLDSFIDNLGYYLRSVVQRTFRRGAYRESDWLANWTIFYWAWWIAWSPFVGTFIARISRGRTVREFVLGVLLVPTLMTFGWLTVFGNTALHMQIVEGIDIASAVQADSSTAIYALLEQLPLSGVAAPLAVVLVALFFVTSSDSGSLVVDMLTSGGHPDPPVWQRIFWALTEGAVAASLLWLGGLRALQSASISAGLPLLAVLSLMVVGLLRALAREHDRSQRVAAGGGRDSIDGERSHRPR
jgi:choline/glycine/proline betaine transport protein